MAERIYRAHGLSLSVPADYEDLSTLFIAGIADANFELCWISSPLTPEQPTLQDWLTSQRQQMQEVMDLDLLGPDAIGCAVGQGWQLTTTDGAAVSAYIELDNDQWLSLLVADEIAMQAGSAVAELLQRIQLPQTEASKLDVVTPYFVLCGSEELRYRPRYHFERQLGNGDGLIVLQVWCNDVADAEPPTAGQDGGDQIEWLGTSVLLQQDAQQNHASEDDIADSQPGADDADEWEEDDEPSNDEAPMVKFQARRLLEPDLMLHLAGSATLGSPWLAAVRALALSMTDNPEERHGG